MGSPVKLGILLLRCSFLLVEELLPKACGRRKQKFLGQIEKSTPLGSSSDFQAAAFEIARSSEHSSAVGNAGP
jgi:hypothetical protein